MDADAPAAAQRLEMVRLAAEALGPAVQVDDLELRREGRSYTMDTLRQLKKAHPKDALYLLMGTDMFLTFHRWREPGEIAKLCTLCAFGRSEKDSEELFSVQRAYLRETLGADVVTIALPHIVDISSTRLREHLAEGGGGEYLDPAVYGYILREELYGVKRNLKALPLDELRCVALSMLRRKRVPHVLGTEQTAGELALRWGEDEETARRAAGQGFDYFTTTLSISPLKNAKKLNEIGQKLAEEHGIAWLPSDFKKRDGYKRSVELSAQYGLYRQDYCGCTYSVRGTERQA